MRLKGYLMVKSSRIFALTTSILLLAAGCGGDDEAPSPSNFASTYEVASHTRNLLGCDAEGEMFDGEDFFRLSEEGGGLVYYRCTAADECAGSDATKGFDSFEGDKWVGTNIAAVELRGACDVNLLERTATLVNGDDIRIETLSYAGEFPREDGQECNDELVLSHRDEFSCVRRDIIVAVPVEN
jgi:hypothetical protein